jgi:hypothetical protein
MVNDLVPSWVALHQRNNSLAIRVKVGWAAKVIEVKRQQILTRDDCAALTKGQSRVSASAASSVFASDARLCSTAFAVWRLSEDLVSGMVFAHERALIRGRLAGHPSWKRIN